MAMTKFSMRRSRRANWLRALRRSGAFVMFVLLCLGATSASAVTFDYESATGTITGFSGVGSKTVTQANTAAGETLSAVSVSENMGGVTVSGATPYAGTDSLFASANVNGETSVTFSLVSGKLFDLTSIAFIETIADPDGETVTLTSAKGSITYALGSLASGSFNVAGDGNAARMQGITSFTVTTVDGSFVIGFDDIVLLNITSPPSAPTATTDSASSVSATGATLNGTINDNGADTTVTFDHGLDTNYGTNTAATTGGTVTSGAGSTAVSTALTGLACNTTYHFRVKGVNSAGTTNGSDVSFTTSKCSQTITFNDPGAQNFGTTPTLTATSDSSLSVTFTSSTTSVCTITSGGALTFVTSGTCTINADQAGDATYAAASTVSRSFTVNAVVPGAPTIGTATSGDTQVSVTFSAPASNGGATITGYTATASPGGATGTSASSPITVTGLTNGTAYTFTVTATNSAGTGSASAASNSATPQATQTITFNNPGAQNFGTTPTLTASADSGLTVDFTSSTTSVCTITSAGALTFVATGTCSIHADQAGNASYVAAPTVSRSFTVVAVVPGAPTSATASVGDGEATVSFVAPVFVGGAAITGYTVTSSPGGITGTGAFSPITVTGLTNGVAYTFTVTATNSAGTGSASSASNSVTPIAGPAVSGVAVPANGSYRAGDHLNFTVTWDQNTSITGTPRIALVIGAATVYATYQSSPTATTSLFRYTVLSGQNDSNGIAVGALMLNGGAIRNINGTDATLTLNSVPATANVLVDTMAPTLPAANIVVNNQADPHQVVLTFSENIDSGTLGAAGDWTLTGNGGNPIYSVASVALSSNNIVTLTLTTVDLADNTSYVTNSAATAGLKVTPPATLTDLAGNSYAAGVVTESGATHALDSTAPTISSIGTSAPTTAGGTLAAIASEKAMGYWIVVASGATAPTVAQVKAGANYGAVTVVSYSSGAMPGGSQATFSLTGLAVGTSYDIYLVAQDVAGNLMSAVASTALTSSKLSQTITFNDPGTQIFGTASTLTASADSGLTPSFSSSTTSVCAITGGGVLTFIASGTCTISADQVGDATYYSAPTVTRSFAVNAVAPGAPTIGAATAGNALASVTFAAPNFTGGAAISSYTVTSSPGGRTATGAASPLTVTGLTNGTSYTFSVVASNSAGSGAASSASNSVMPLDDLAVTAPADINVDAVGLFTPVDIGTATATDGSLTPTVTHVNGEEVAAHTTYFRPGVNTVTWAVTDAYARTATATQVVNVTPLVSFSKSQFSAEGATASFSVILNGAPVTYPVTVPYTVGGTAASDGSDHDAVNGSVVISSPNLEASVNVQLVNDGVGEGAENVVLTMGVPTNAVVGPVTSHTITILEGNVAPSVVLVADQGSGATRIIGRSNGAVTVTASVSDPNVGDTHSYSWDGTDNTLIDTDSVGETFTIDPSGLVPGLYNVMVVVSDRTATAQAQLVLKVVSTLPSLSVADTDSDGVGDNVEGAGDNDSDGIPNYLDSATMARNVLQQELANDRAFLVETESGLVISLGQIAFQAGANKAHVTDREVQAYANDGAGAVLDKGQTFDGGLFDFNVAELPVVGQQVRIVLAQFSPIPAKAVYRKLMSAGWQDFIVDANNSLASAAGAEGYCPPPGDSAYTAGLTEGYWCVQLTIEDGGPNDADGMADANIKDPGGVGVDISQLVVVTSSASGGAGILSCSLVVLLSMGVFVRRRADKARRRARACVA